ncbi:MAG: methyltransferase, partial [Pseudomonadota bacterium]
RDLLGRLNLSSFSRLLDLGCGTGLTGMALVDCTAHRTGIDLSEKIVELAFDREVYDDLYVGEAVAFLQEFEEEDGQRPVWDLITATDVFPYLGAVEPFLRGAVQRLSPGGYLAFSTETLPDPVMGGQPYVVGPKNRFAQGEGYIRTALASAGFDILAMEPITVRLEEGDPVPGHLLVARLHERAG